MSKAFLYELNIDPEFRNLSPALPAQEYELLEKDMLHSGCMEPIIVWNGYIVDGHQRYDICHKWSLPFCVSSTHFFSREDAISWICKNHLKKDYLPDAMQRYLIGKDFIAEKVITARKFENVDLQGKKLKSHDIAAGKLSMENYISCHSVYKYGMVANAFDSIFQKEPELCHQILAGQIKISNRNVVSLSKMSKERLRSLYRYLSDCKKSHIILADIEGELQNRPSIARQRPVRTSPPRNTATQVKTNIKEMPKYDPDAGISSLAFTIPSWISMIERIQSTADMMQISFDARQRIKQQLSDLRLVSESLLNALKESE